MFLGTTVWAQSASNHYVGSNTCKKCHPDIWSGFYKNPHAKTLTHAEDAAAGCETCHGPGGNHVAAGGGKATIIAFSQLEPAKVLDQCLACHAETLSRANIRRSPHTAAGMACNSCHSIHKSPTPKALLAKKQTDLCYGCHTQVRAQFSMPVKHRVNEGFMNCSDCHNPHGSFAPVNRPGGHPRMAQQSMPDEEACLKCHTDKRGPFVFEHAGVRLEGCASCHFPHGSTNARLLRRPVVFTLCLECHNGNGNFGRTGTGVPTQNGSHNMANPRFQNCTTCHAAIHGSNADARFLR